MTHNSFLCICLYFELSTCFEHIVLNIRRDFRPAHDTATGTEWQLPEVVLTQFVSPDYEHDVLETCRELNIYIYKYIENNCASRWSFTRNLYMIHGQQNIKFYMCVCVCVCVCMCVCACVQKHTQTQTFPDLRHSGLHHHSYFRQWHDRFTPRYVSAVRMPKRRCCVWSLCFCFRYYFYIKYCIWVPDTVFTFYFFPSGESMYMYKAFPTQDSGDLRPSL